MMNLKKLRIDLQPLSNYEVVVFGSQVTGGTRPNSDVDVAIITREKNKEKNIQLYNQILGKVPSKYDIKIFELLPIHIQMSIINDHIVIFGDKIELSEYFYFYRKIWNDCKHRILGEQFNHYEEKLAAMDWFNKNREKIIKKIKSK